MSIEDNCTVHLADLVVQIHWYHRPIQARSQFENQEHQDRRCMEVVGRMERTDSLRRMEDPSCMIAWSTNDAKAVRIWWCAAGLAVRPAIDYSQVDHRENVDVIMHVGGEWQSPE
jgi:hypothetical protein